MTFLSDSHLATLDKSYAKKQKFHVHFVVPESSRFYYVYRPTSILGNSPKDQTSRPILIKYFMWTKCTRISRC